MSLTFTNLPTDIHAAIREYLPPDDYLCLLNTSKAIFIQTKRNHVYLSLHAQCSLRFLQDEEFRLRVMRSVQEPRRQIALSILDPEDELIMLEPDLTVHKIVCSPRISLSTIPYIPHVSEFTSYDPFTNINNGQYFRSLSIELTDSVTDISSLANVQNLEIHKGRGLKEDTFKSLGSQKTLLLHNCPGLVSLHNLSTVQQLTLNGCPNITDIRPLHGIRDLSIMRCPQINDISGLGDHKALTIMNCAYQLKGYHILRNIPIISLNRCDIRDLSVLQDARRVCLISCNEIIDVTPVRNARLVNLHDCSQIKDISCLNGVRDLTVGRLPSLTTSITSMKEHCVLSTSGDAGSDFLIHYHATQRLVILQDFPDLDKISLLPFLKMIKLFYLQNDFSFIGLGNIHTIIVEDCYEISSLEGLGNNRCVELKYCHKITDVSCLKNVPIVKISYCSGITDYSCLRDVPRLQIKELHTN